MIHINSYRFLILIFFITINSCCVINKSRYHYNSAYLNTNKRYSGFVIKSIDDNALYIVVGNPKKLFYPNDNRLINLSGIDFMIDITGYDHIIYHNENRFKNEDLEFYNNKFNWTIDRNLFSINNEKKSVIIFIEFKLIEINRIIDTERVKYYITLDYDLIQRGNNVKVYYGKFKPINIQFKTYNEFFGIK